MRKHDATSTPNARKMSFPAHQQKGYKQELQQSPTSCLLKILTGSHPLVAQIAQVDIVCSAIRCLWLDYFRGGTDFVKKELLKGKKSSHQRALIGEGEGATHLAHGRDTHDHPNAGEHASFLPSAKFTGCAALSITRVLSADCEHDARRFLIAHSPDYRMIVKVEEELLTTYRIGLPFTRERAG